MVHDPVEIVYNAAGLSENTSQARDGSGKAVRAVNELSSNELDIIQVYIIKI
jgi:hypothetical protein